MKCPAPGSINVDHGIILRRTLGDGLISGVPLTPRSLRFTHVLVFDELSMSFDEGKL
jgi:hypothetical protein